MPPYLRALLQNQQLFPCKSDGDAYFDEKTNEQSMTKTEIAVECHGVRVPASPYLTETRIDRIAQARYEGDEIKGALLVTTEKDRVLEMGSGLGIVGAVCTLNAKPERVISFEANPDMLPHINALYEENDLTDRIEVRNQLVIANPDRPATMTFHVQNSFLGSSLIAKANRRTREVEIPTVSFAEVVEELKPTVLLCDIEGGELDLLEHADLSGIRAIVMEFHPEAYEVEGMRKCKRILTQAGFEKNEDVSTRKVWTCTREV
jgi:FkbM family methyltransferase